MTMQSSDLKYHMSSGAESTLQRVQVWLAGWGRTAKWSYNCTAGEDFRTVSNVQKPSRTYGSDQKEKKRRGYTYRYVYIYIDINGLYMRPSYHKQYIYLWASFKYDRPQELP